jgi:CBS domain containing-hemolysin-like protein
MLEAVFEFPTTTVGEIMTPRTDVIGIEASADLDNVREMIQKHGHSRIPVYEENLDNIQGILYAKDLLRYVGTDLPFEMGEVLRHALMVPESKPLAALLADFKANKVHIAIVLDEYGGTAGLVTIEDIVEEVVGEIQDEYEPQDEKPEFRKLEDGSYEVEARMRVDDVNDELGLDWPEDEDYDTVGGFVFSTIGHVPEQGESFDFQDCRVTVIDVERTRVNQVRIEKIERSGVGEESRAG